jgi:hypothetical protein
MQETAKPTRLTHLQAGINEHKVVPICFAALLDCSYCLLVDQIESHPLCSYMYGHVGPVCFPNYFSLLM